MAVFCSNFCEAQSGEKAGKQERDRVRQIEIHRTVQLG